ncbi:MAG: hypothetical protein ACOVPA_11120, partial [Rubrivivax sp.]
NDAVDAWFAGWAPGVVGVAWMGYDEPRSLGEGESGGGLALLLLRGLGEGHQRLQGVAEHQGPAGQGHQASAPAVGAERPGRHGHVHRLADASSPQTLPMPDQCRPQA